MKKVMKEIKETLKLGVLLFGCSFGEGLDAIGNSISLFGTKIVKKCVNKAHEIDSRVEEI